MPSVLTQVSMPRSHVSGREYTRSNGDAWITLHAGVLDEGSGPVVQSLPYGPMPRLAMAHISTYAKKYRTREIFIGDSATAFLAQMGMTSDGYRHKKLRQQMHALAACHMQMGYRGRTYAGTPITQFDAWSSDRDMTRRSLWPGVLVLSEDFFRVLDDSAVPLDLRAMLSLRGSSLAMDQYFWLAHRLHRINGRPVLLHWKQLREQFAPDYSTKNFKKQFLPALQRVLLVYPQAQVRQVKGGLVLRSSPPPVKYKE